MSRTEILNNTTELICGLKAAAKLLECKHKALLNDDAQISQKQPYMMVPICDDDRKQVPRNKPNKCKIRDELKKTQENRDAEKTKCPPKYKIPEMKMSYLHYKCFCLHRNGLQDECPLSTCQGKPECLVKPWPVCPPGKYFRSQNPELYPPVSKLNNKCKNN